MTKYRKIFIPNMTSKWTITPLQEMAEDVISVCGAPMYDDRVGLEYVDEFEGSIKRAMHNFDPELDAVALFGDPIVFAMMVAFAMNGAAKSDGYVTLLRFNQKAARYTERLIDEDLFNHESAAGTEGRARA